MSTKSGTAATDQRAPKVRAPKAQGAKATATQVHTGKAATPKVRGSQTTRATKASDAPSVDNSVLNQYRIHPAANDFPMMSDDELRQLADDIAENGQAESALRYKGEIIDGRNRIVACNHAGRSPRIEEWTPRYPGDTPSKFIYSKNLSRRHLTASQRATIAVTLAERIREENDRLRAEDRQRRKATKATDSATLFSNAAAAVDRPLGLGDPGDPGTAKPFTPPAQRTGTAEESDQAPAADETAPKGRVSYGKAREQAAELVNVSSAYVGDAKALAADDPDLFRKVSTGELTLPKAQETLVRNAQVAGTLGQLQTRDGAVKAILDRINGTQKKKEEEPASRPRISVRKFGKVESSRVTVSMTVTFGNPDVADEILNGLVSNPKVLDYTVDVVPEGKKPAGAKKTAAAKR